MNDHLHQAMSDLVGAASRTAPADQGRQLFEQALAEAGQRPFELARVHLAFGQYLRRARATRDARTQLRAALELFLALDATDWAERAALELRATAPARRRGGCAAWPSLTAQEYEIASLAAAGLTNKQIGQRLYLSPRTVSNHLYRLFPKLGISRRAGLRDALNAMASGDGTPLRDVA